MREWLHVDDHCRAIALVLAKGRAGEVYNIGGDVELTNRALTERLLLAGAGWDRVRHVADRKVQDQRYSLDYTKISEELGFEPQIRFATGWPRSSTGTGRTGPGGRTPPRRPAPAR